MLKGIDPALNADVLWVLKSMGHGDDLILADMNFPSESVSQSTVYGELLRMENVTAARAAKAILSVMPLDSFVDKPALRMEIVGKPNEIPPVQAEVQADYILAIHAERDRINADIGIILDAYLDDTKKGEQLRVYIGELTALRNDFRRLISLFKTSQNLTD